MKRFVILVCLAIALVAHSASPKASAVKVTRAPASADRSRLRRIPIKEVKGKVLSWDPWASSWARVDSGSELWESSLVQVTEGSTVTFALRTADGFSGLQSDEVEVSMNRPSVFRLDANILRKVDLNSFFIPQMPDIMQAKEGKSGILYDSFQEAWQRFAAIVVPGKMKADANWLSDAAKNEKEQDATVATKAKRIQLFSPTENMMLVADKIPMEFTVLWKPVPEPGLEYEVMVWRIDQPRRPPIAVTRFDYYFAKQFQDGDFYVQVATHDGRYQSPVRTVHVLLPAQGTLSHTTNATIGRDPLPLSLPPDGFHYVTHQFPAEVTFTWERGLLATGTAYQFVLRDAGGKELVRRMTSDRTLRLKINRPGDYKWQIEGVPQPTDHKGTVAAKVYSEVRNFQLQNAVDLVSHPLTQMLEELVASGKSGVVYSEDGL